jgi:hypothetical protein
MTEMEEEMNKLSREALARLEKISEDERRQLGHILTMLADCYGEGATGMAVISFRVNEGLTALLGVNTSDMDAAEILREAADIMSHALVVDAPPKEMFN